MKSELFLVPQNGLLLDSESVEGDPPTGTMVPGAVLITLIKNF
jgi:hypothetical protein